MKAKFTFGALIGAAAGIVAGMLTAPKSGRETRADLKLKARELKAGAAKRAGNYNVRGGRATNGTRRDVTGKK